MSECQYCDRSFGSPQATRQHMNAVGHWACDDCGVGYYDEQDRDEHMQYDYCQESKIECEGCYNRYDTHQEARRHMETYDHWRMYRCNDCDRGFQNRNNLQQHLNSSVHRGTNISCPFCKRSFATARGVTHHLESGSCPKATNLNRDTILNEIRKRDPHHVVTKKLLTYPDSGSSLRATSSTWNGDAYECYLCHREFGSLSALNQHVNSPAHRQKVYHCPGRRCAKEFVSLAALFNHLESEACGAVRFDQVQKNVGGFLTGKRMIAF